MTILNWSLGTDNSSRYDEDSSVFASAIESSNQFVSGEYEHNLEVLEYLDDVYSASGNDFDEDRLIYAATKKFAPAANSQSARHIVVSSEELNRENSSSFDIEDQQHAQNNPWRPFMIFRHDKSCREVSKEEIRRVRVMHKRFMEGSEFGFNYNVLLMIASLIAALGLGGNSTATIIASMLVSPLMGPVMGMAYAATILDLKMFYIALVTELVSLVTCIVVGAVVAACMIPFMELPEDWPTIEMESRGSMFNLYIGIPIAFASGLGVAVSVLDEQTASLVGVAISASLLPPAINAGMLWTTYFFNDAEANAEHRFGREGFISLGLTLINILMIIVASMLMFRIKERLPLRKKRIFWTDLGLARKIYQNLVIYDKRNENPVRRMGARASFITKSFRSSRISIFRSKSPNRQSSRGASTASPDVPNALRAATAHIPTAIDRRLSTVNEKLPIVQEERI